ncbi:MAG: methionine synthase [Treponema sp.]|jgi:5-methyltetrahydrofolate--homocysteine methyltransferase|nr:methionine synthase [Treponema sp.]
MNIRKLLNTIAAERILVLDGAMGTMVQSCKLTDADYRGERFAAHKTPLLGCNDILCLTRPAVISGIHEAYLQAGADIIETCSLNASAVSLADYNISNLSYEISRAAASIAKEAAGKFSTADKPRFVAGSIGPTTKSASMSPDMDNPGKRGVTWDELTAAYYDNVRGLLDGGADILLAETLYDTLNAKAAAFAINTLLKERNIDIPLILSATISDTAGRLLSGQTVEAFCVSVLHSRPWAVGLNCSFGAEKLKASVRELAAAAPCMVSAYPNAGMPNQFGAYDETPESMAVYIEEYLSEGLVNIVGGCCGTTPAHIAVIAEKAKRYPPRKIPSARRGTFLAGLEPLCIADTFIKIGERTNVAGSKKFLTLIKEEKYTEAMGIARQMIENGASIINVCMDDALLDAENAMTSFLNLALSDPDIARVPIMIDSSRWNVIEAGLKCVQGKSLVNSISLKEGEEEFLRRAALAHAYGAAVVVMLIDENGQAASYERKIEVAKRSWDLLIRLLPPEDIIFDPNVLTIATGIPEHDKYALDFINACAWIKEHCPGAQISGGISNLSFSFRGNEAVREAMHAVFLKHAIAAGLTMAIVNPAAQLAYDEPDPALRSAVEDVIFCRATVDRLLAIAEQLHSRANTPPSALHLPPSKDWRNLPVEDRVIHAMVKGIDDFIEADVLELREKFDRSLRIVEGPLMNGMKEVGNLFGKGQMFLPQVIRSARVMKKAVAVLEPFIEQEKTRPASDQSNAPKVLLATVKGDVHDIGKNIVGVVLGCNGCEIIDLGIMTPSEKIIETAIEKKVDIIGLSGLISPSLDEMVHTAREMETRGLKIPLIVGGAAASTAHTAVRIAPEYSGPVVYVSDAGRSAETVRALLSDTERPKFLETLETVYGEAVQRHEKILRFSELLPLADARKNKIPMVSYIPIEPKIKDTIELKDYPVERVVPHIDWASFLQTWDLAGETYPLAYTGVEQKKRREAQNKLMEDAHALLDRISAEGLLTLQGVIGFYPAYSENDDIIICDPGAPDTEIARFCFPRNQERKRAGGPNPCLADLVLPQGDWIGLFTLSAGFGLTEAAAEYKAKHDDYGAILLASLANTLAEAFSEEAHLRVQQEWRGGAQAGIRPAFGYPACPDHRDKEIAFNLLGARERCGLKLTDSGMIIPAASVCGLYLASPAAYYFGVGRLGDDQLADWAARKGISTYEAEKRLGRI